MGLADQVVHARLRLAQRQRPLGEVDALLELALLAGHQGHVIERLGVRGVVAQDLGVVVHGAGDLALAMVEKTLLQELIGGGGGIGHGRGLSRVWGHSQVLPLPWAGAGGAGRGMTVPGRRAMQPGNPELRPQGRESGREMKDILDRLDTAAGRGPAGRRRKAHRGPAQARQADRPRAHRAAARQGLVRGVRHVRRAPLHRLRHGQAEDPRRRRGHRLGHGQRPRGLPVLQGLHRVRRLALGDPRAEDHQGPGHGAEGARADHRPVRRRRRPHPGGRGRARRLWRGVQAQRHRLGRHPADQRHHGPVRRRRRLFAGDDRLHLHGARHLLHVRHRPGRGEDRHE